MADDHLTLLSQADALLEQGLQSQAAELYRRICRENPVISDAWLMLGMIYGDTGNFSEAIQHLHKCLEIEPKTAEAHYSLARIYMHLLDDESAYKHVAQATLDDTYLEAWLLRAVLSAKLGVYVEAELCATKVIQLSPSEIEGYVNLAHAQLKLNKVSDARMTLDAALRIAPNRGDAIHMHAHACELQNDLAGADISYRRLTEIPTLAHFGHMGISKIKMNEGDSANALAHAQAAIESNPNHADPFLHCAELLHAVGRHEEAITRYSEAERLAPASARIFELHADVEQELGLVDRADRLYGQSLQNAESVSAIVKRAILVPVIMESDSAVQRSRGTLLDNIRELKARKLRIDNPAATISKLPFYTVYHGLDDLEINRALADFYSASAPGLMYTAPHVDASRTGKSKITIGFISRFFCSHTIGEVMKGIIKHLSRDFFEVVLLTFPYHGDPLTAEIMASVDRVVYLPKDWTKAHGVVAAQTLDILFYTDVGMDPYTYFLTYARLAPVQCTTWGHAVTTGVPNMDYYLTCETFEPEGADLHYSERLVRLGSAPTFYQRPQKSRANLSPLSGLNKNMNNYLCPQVLYKFHPEFDAFIGGILRGDANGEVILLECRHKSWLDLLQSRLKKSLPDVVDRIKVLPYPGAAGYLKLIETCDVMLDTYHYGGGSTSLQGLGLGTPIVTLPGNFQRGRHTYSYYQRMKINECVAADRDDYVQIALRIGKDKDYRYSLSERISDASDVLFSNVNVVREMEDFFIKSIGVL